MYTPRHLAGLNHGMGNYGFDPSALLSNPGGLISSLAGGVNAQIVIRSQLSPEIRMNVADLLAGKESGVQSDSPGMMQIVRPEITITAAGLSHSFAPYGKPVANYFAIMLGGVTAASLIGAAIAWRLCRG